MYNYCTLFDSNYLTRGLAMYESLKKNSGDFHLYIFAFDERSCDLLKRLELDHVTVVSLLEFEDETLLKIKRERTAGEYCWTCTPSVIKYAIEKHSLGNCTYLDADLYFFSDPAVLIDEMKEKSVLITEHRYTAVYDQAETSGKYCVQFMTFKNDSNGLKVLDWWQNACNEWCYNRFEDGKFGDQKYLDNWTNQFEGVHELENIGGGVAPWNVQQYSFISENKKVIGKDKISNDNFELIFYHFHALKFLDKHKVELGIYELEKQAVNILYKEYITALCSISLNLKRFDSHFDYNGAVETPSNLRSLLVKLKRRIKGTYNIYKLKELKRL